MSDLNSTGYAAGVFDAKGSIFPVRSTRQLRVVVPGISEELGDRLVSLFHGRVQKSVSESKTTYQWIISKKEDLLAFLVSVRPFLHVKQFAVDEAIAFLYVAKPYTKWGPAQQTAWEDCLRMNK